MAEPKRANDFEYMPYEAPQINPDPVPEEPKQEPDRKSDYEPATKVPVSPARHLKRLSNMEKLLLGVILTAIVGVSILTIQLRTTITQVENEISAVQTQISEEESKAETLDQEKTDLSRPERLKEIAEQNGLSDNADNLRTVK